METSSSCFGSRKAYHRPHFIDICVKIRGVRFHRNRDFKQYYLNSVPPTSHCSRPCLGSAGAGTPPAKAAGRPDGPPGAPMPWPHSFAGDRGSDPLFGCGQNGVNTNGTAAKVMNFDRLGTRCAPWHFWEDKSRLTGEPKKSLSKNMKFAVTP